MLGVGLGSEADVAPYLLAHYFGRKHFSVLYGLTWTAYAIGGATGPIAIGHYIIAQVSINLALSSTLLVWVLPP